MQKRVGVNISVCDLVYAVQCKKSWSINWCYESSLRLSALELAEEDESLLHINCWAKQAMKVKQHETSFTMKPSHTQTGADPSGK